MDYDLGKVGIEKDLQYECIITTVSEDGVRNAGAFTFTYLGGDRVSCMIFEGSKTLENIQNTKEYVVNITQNPLVFTYAALDCLGDEYFSSDDDIAIIKNTPAYIIVDVENVEKMSHEEFPIKDDRNLFSITGKIRDFVINDENAQAFNRGLSALIESLVSFSRYKIVDDAKRKEYMDRLLENQMIIENVSDDKTKKAMAKLKSEYKKN